MARSENAMREAFCNKEVKGQAMELKINDGKINYVKLSTAETRRKIQNITIGEYCFEGVKEFVYFGSSLNNSTNMTEEIKRRIMASSRAYYANITLFQSNLLSKITKMKLYKTLIRLVACYGVKTWTLLKADTNCLKIFEKKK